MRTVHVRVGHDVDAVVTHIGKVDIVCRLVRIHADRHRDIVNFIVRKQAVFFNFEGIEHLTAQRQDGLEFLVAALFGGATGGVSLHQKQFGAGGIAGTAVGEFAR